MTNFSSLKMQAELALAKLTEGKHYVLADINERFQKTATMYPQDTVINAMASIIEQLHHKHPGQFISQSDIEKLYGELVGLNVSGSRFREVMGDLLLSEKAASVEPNTSYIQGIRDTNTDALEYNVDSGIKAELDKAFAPVADKYDPRRATAAKNKVELELMSIGFDNARVKLAGGNAKVLIFTAEIDTNRGTATVQIPVDASGEQLPKSFIANDKLEELNLPALTSYLAEQHGNCLSNKEAGEVQMPRVSMPDPLKSLASNLDESVIEAAVGFPQAAVRLTKRMLVAELNSMGFKGSQIKVMAPTNDGFICEAIINTPRGKVAIEIPIEMKGNSPLLPSVFAKGDYVADFNAASLRAFAMSDVGGASSVSRQMSDLNSMDFSQLRDLVVKAALDGDFESCDEALAVIGEKCDENTFRNVIADYQKMLLNMENARNSINMAYDDSDQFVKTPNSIYPIHKKLGRPVNELIRDENGVYHLKSTYASRQNQKEGSVLFNTAKVLVGD